MDPYDNVTLGPLRRAVLPDVVQKYDPLAVEKQVKAAKDYYDIGVNLVKGTGVIGEAGWKATGALPSGVDRAVGQEGAVGKSLDDPKSTVKNAVDLDYDIGQGAQTIAITGGKAVMEEPSGLPTTSGPSTKERTGYPRPSRQERHQTWKT